MVKNRSHASGLTLPLTAAHPKTGGMAPEAPPITIFCGVSGFRTTVYKNAYPANVAKVRYAVMLFTKVISIVNPIAPSKIAKINV